MLARLLRRLKCRLGYHTYKETEILHIEYAKDGYDVEEYYVKVCVHCGRKAPPPKEAE